MKLQEQINAKCGECGGRKEIIQHEIYGCDWCGTNIDYNESHLQSTVFRHDAETDHLHFCSWSCALAKLKTLKSDYFVTLPHVHYDATPRPQHVRSFLKLVDWTAVAENAGKKMGRAPRKGKK